MCLARRMTSNSDLVSVPRIQCNEFNIVGDSDFIIYYRKLFSFRFWLQHCLSRKKWREYGKLSEEKTRLNATYIVSLHSHNAFLYFASKLLFWKKRRVNHNNHLSYDLASHNLLLLLLLSKHGLEKRIHSNWFRFLFNVITKRNVVTLVELNKHAFKDTLISSARCRCWCWCHNAIISTNRKEILFKSRFVSIQTRYVRIQKLVFIFLEKNPFRYLIFRMEYFLAFRCAINW